MKQKNLLPLIRATATEELSPALRPWKRFDLGKIAQKLVNLLSSDREPKVYHRRDRQGYSYLEVYDPASCKTHIFKTTHDVRIWLERRYYL
jgi:hypothetical protein